MDRGAGGNPGAATELAGELTGLAAKPILAGVQSLLLDQATIRSYTARSRAPDPNRGSGSGCRNRRGHPYFSDRRDCAPIAGETTPPRCHRGCSPARALRGRLVRLLSLGEQHGPPLHLARFRPLQCHRRSIFLHVFGYSERDSCSSSCSSGNHGSLSEHLYHTHDLPYERL